MVISRNKRPFELFRHLLVVPFGLPTRSEHNCRCFCSSSSLPLCLKLVRQPDSSFPLQCSTSLSPVSCDRWSDLESLLDLRTRMVWLHSLRLMQECRMLTRVSNDTDWDNGEVSHISSSGRCNEPLSMRLSVPSPDVPIFF
jgi:hypothetical protein